MPPATSTPKPPDLVRRSFHERLQDLPPAMAEALRAVGTRRQWRPGQLVVRQGDSGGMLVVALQGRLSASLGSADGDELLLRRLEPGELIGLVDVLAGLPSPANIVAQGAATSLHVGRDDFLRVMAEQPEGAVGVAMLLARRLAGLFRTLEQQQTRPLIDRVGFALKRLARSAGEPDGQGGLRLVITQTELAHAAGGSRQRVHLALRQLQAQGRVKLGYRSLTVLAEA